MGKQLLGRSRDNSANSFSVLTEAFDVHREKKGFYAI